VLQILWCLAEIELFLLDYELYLSFIESYQSLVVCCKQQPVLHPQFDQKILSSKGYIHCKCEGTTGSMDRLSRRRLHVSLADDWTVQNPAQLQQSYSQQLQKKISMYNVPKILWLAYCTIIHIRVGQFLWIA
jgi:hypothetical protein